MDDFADSLIERVPVPEEEPESMNPASDKPRLARAVTLSSDRMSFSYRSDGYVRVTFKEISTDSLADGFAEINELVMELAETISELKAAM